MIEDGEAVKKEDWQNGLVRENDRISYDAASRDGAHRLNNFPAAGASLLRRA
ncbi:MAG: hypothetical protein JW768_03315 [Chitinispirillaceae bacterium]|nr:hypothetical protein [Chitinispirillaceae bacterium]